MNIADLYKEHAAWLNGVLRRRGRRKHESEDIVHDVFVRVILYTRKGGVIANAPAFLQRIALNAAVDDHRHEQIQKTAARSIEALFCPATLPGPEEEACADELIARRDKVLEEAVEPRARTAYWLSCFGVTQKDIARRLKVSPDTVSRDIAKALEILSREKQRSTPP